MKGKTQPKERFLDIKSIKSNGTGINMLKSGFSFIKM
jgi:hypothetical protein